MFLLGFERRQIGSESVTSIREFHTHTWCVVPEKRRQRFRQGQTARRHRERWRQSFNKYFYFAVLFLDSVPPQNLLY